MERLIKYSMIVFFLIQKSSVQPLFHPELWRRPAPVNRESSINKPTNSDGESGTKNTSLIEIVVEPGEHHARKADEISKRAGQSVEDQMDDVSQNAITSSGVDHDLDSDIFPIDKRHHNAGKFHWRQQEYEN
jgi:hypothetical protein